MKKQTLEFMKKFIFRYTNLARPKYNYALEPIQLAEIIKGIDSIIALDKKTCIIEIGVARGVTTRFIAEHIKLQQHKVNYYCIDTFSSFTKSDLDFEINHRGKNRKELIGFGYNDYNVWKNNFKEFDFITAIQTDCSEFDFSKLKPIDFCFLDVDLYIPTKNVLENIWEHMSENSLIIVDDVLPNNSWDGAYQAFMEFVKDKKLDYKIVGNKCGIIKKQ